MEGVTTPAMDWYPDPADPTRERYWDGTQWTHNTRPAAPQPPAPAPMAPAQTNPYLRNMPEQGAAGQQGTGYPTQNVGHQTMGQQHQAQPGWQPGPYQMAVDPGSLTDDGVPLAGWWQRVGAEIIDSILLGIVTFLVGFPWIRQIYQASRRMLNDILAQAQAGNQTTTTPDLSKYGLDTSVTLSLAAVSIGLALLYWVLCWRFRGASLGQMIAGIRVVPTGQGQAPRALPWTQAIVRGIVKTLLGEGNNLPGIGTLLGLLWFVSCLLPLGQARRQTFHDMAARTQVVRSR